MTCSGLHCSACAGGATVPVVPLAALLGIEWVAEHIIEVAVVCATCGALAVAAVVALMKWCGRREARRAAVRLFWTVRAGTAIAPAAIAPAAAGEPAAADEAPPAARGAIAAAPAIHFHFHVATADERAAIIRQALPGHAGDETAGEESA